MLIQLDDGTDDDRIYFQYDAAGTTLNWGVYVGGVQTAGTGVTLAPFIRGEPFRIKIIAGGGSVSAKIAGNASETLAAQPVVDRIRYGNNVAGTGTGGMWLRGRTLYPYTKSIGWLNAIATS
jgi:hypothetical protein